jgi:predicted nucleic acid-binding protein
MRIRMTSFFPDLNVWLALSVAGHSHSADAWTWVNLLPRETQLIFCRYTHIGLLRLLTNPAVMGEQTLTLRKAWSVYDRWLADPRVGFYPEPRDADAEFRRVTEPFGARPASKWIGDDWLLASSNGLQSTLVTFDKALYRHARKHGYSVMMPGRDRRRP